MLKKCISILLCLVLAMSVMCIETFAAETIDFNDKSADFKFSSLASGDKTFINAKINLSDFSNSGADPFGYEAGVFGKSEDDHSKTLRIHSTDGINITNTNANTVFYSIEKTTIPDNGQYYEFMAAASGSAEVDVQVGGSYKSVLTSDANWNSTGWNKVGLWFPINAEKTEFYVYLNGNKIYDKNVDKITKNLRIRLRVTIPNGTKDAFAAFDDYYKSDSGLTACPEYKEINLTSASGILEGDSVLYENPESMTVADLKEDITIGENVTANVCSSALVVPQAMAAKGSTCATEYANPKDDSENIAAGDKLILTEGGNVRTVTISDISSLTTNIDFDANDAEITPKKSSATVTSSKETGVSLNTTKALKISATKTTETATSAARVELDKLDNNALIGNSKATIEFSMLATGAYNMFEAQCYYNDGDAKNRNFKMFETDAQGIGTNGFVKGINLDNKWTRVALTLDPVNYSYDVYVNGDRVVSGGELIHTNNNFSLVRIGANIQPSSTSDAAILAVDDITIYAGGYKYDKTIAAPDNACETNCKIYANKTYDYTAFMDSVSIVEGDSKALYSYQNGTYTQKSDSVEEGDILVITSADKLLRKYFTVTKNSELIFTKPVIDAANTISASCSVKYFSCDPSEQKKAVLVLAVYDGNKLIKVVSDAKEDISATGSYQFSADSTEEAKSGISAKAFMWDTFKTLKPYDVEIGEYSFNQE